MYRHVYWQTWQALSDVSRQLLQQAMPLTGQEGGGTVGATSVRSVAL